MQQFLLDEGLLDGGHARLRSLILPDIFQEHGTPGGQYAEAGLDARSIVARTTELLDMFASHPRQRTGAAETAMTDRTAT